MRECPFKILLGEEGSLIITDVNITV